MATLDGRMNATEAAIADINGKLDVFAVSLDTLLEILCGCLIMIMQAGFALSVGSVNVTNVYAILLNNVMVVCRSSGQQSGFARDACCHQFCSTCIWRRSCRTLCTIITPPSPLVADASATFALQTTLTF
ncbi:uncharacterized protein LOC118412824 [Branchiostoma floridae]|uniref:Uncharacterized protein LOC118412824 n=1 Tax=Branchiostoma floridae TaxID=7739 RepID=A0A9J7KXT5_BRAFL|nr:uncharacterized protein LOC118412824 [Branchiostoma floridae]